MNLITKLPPRAYMQRVRRNQGIYCDVKTLKCTSAKTTPQTLSHNFVPFHMQNPNFGDRSLF